MRTISPSIVAAITFSSALLTGSAALAGMVDEWPTYRHDNQRTGTQPIASRLSDITAIGYLKIERSFPKDGDCPKAWFCPVGAFSASPIVMNDTVFIGDNKGYLYALDAASLELKWRYPEAGNTVYPNGLIGTDMVVKKWNYGIKSPAAYWDRPPNGAVIFVAQDPTLHPSSCPQGDSKKCDTNSSYGSARLFALDATNGTKIWLSDPIAEINGDSTDFDPEASLEKHERAAYSPPLIFDNKIYVGVQSFENPVQIGRVIAVDLNGHIVPSFQFQAVGTPASLPGTVRGGGVWNGPATDGTSIYFTTGNTARDNGHYTTQTPPNPNYGVSMLQVNKDTGSIGWSFQPVPFKSDCDTDWAAGATVMNTSCGTLIASVQKDGWSYAIDANGPSCPMGGHSWQFPQTFPWTFRRTVLQDPSKCIFDANTPGTCSPNETDPGAIVQNGAVHGDEDYKWPGAAWNDVFIVRTGGEARDPQGNNNPGAGYGQLHALNACATTEDRVRWIADFTTFPLNYSSGGTEAALGAPTVTGGLVFIATDAGALLVIADPQAVPVSEKSSIKYRCSNTDPIYTNPSDCENARYAWVPIPSLVKVIYMPDQGSLIAMRNEPVIAKGRLFLATHKDDTGHVYMLDAPVPVPEPNPCMSSCRRGPSFCCACQGGTWVPNTNRCIFE